MRISNVPTRTIVSVIVLALVLATQGFAEEPITPGDVRGPITWGGVANVTQLRHLYFSGQPDEAALEAARKAGVEVVINLRAPSEFDWNEEATVKALSMDYHNVPVAGSTFEPDAFARIEALLAENRDRVIYLHCSSSNRAAGWLATHLVTQHKMGEEEALAVGRRVGITKEAIEERVRNYLQAGASTTK